MGAADDASPLAVARKLIHDLRQPLAALQMWLDLLDGALRDQVGEKEQRYLGKIRTEIGRMTAMLEHSSSAAAAAAAPAASPPTPAAPAAAGPSEQRNECGLRLGGAPLLVVEDDEVTAEALQLALESEGASVAVAASIADALALFEAARPLAVLSDLSLADGDGYALAAEIRQRDAACGASTVLIAVTGFDSDETRAATRRAGFDEIVTKPFSLAALVDLLERLTAPARG